MRPTYLSSDLRGLLEEHPAPVVQSGEAHCRDAKAWWDGDQLRTSGEDDDALRAACALSWARADGAGDD
jgi:hypothetical protein